MAYPISISEVKMHLNIDQNIFEFDPYLETIVIPTAVERVNMSIDSSMFYMTDDVSCPYMVKTAMLIECKNIFDIERSSYVSNAIKREDIVQRLTFPYKTIVW